MKRISEKSKKYIKRLGEILKKYSKKIGEFGKKSYDIIFKKASKILKKIVKMESKSKSKSKSIKKKKYQKRQKMYQKGGVVGEVVGAATTVARSVGNELLKMCPYNSGGTGGGIDTLAQDLVGVVWKTGCSAGHGLLTTDSLLSLPGNLGTAYRETGAPGVDL